MLTTTEEEQNKSIEHSQNKHINKQTQKGSSPYLNDPGLI